MNKILKFILSKIPKNVILEYLKAHTISGMTSTDAVNVVINELSEDVVEIEGIPYPISHSYKSNHYLPRESGVIVFIPMEVDIDG